MLLINRQVMFYVSILDEKSAAVGVFRTEQVNWFCVKNGGETYKRVRVLSQQKLVRLQEPRQL